MRARATIEPMPGKGDREMIVVTEIPYQVNKAELLKKIARAGAREAHRGHLRPARRVDRDGMRMVIELKRDAHGEIVLNMLYQMTALQSTFGVQLPGHRQWPAPEAAGPASTGLLHFIDHRREVVTRRTRFDLRRPWRSASWSRVSAWP
jgi:DNA gyrase subunit A